MSATYEREFKGILSGDDKVLAKTSKSLTEPEGESYLQTRRRPFLVVRAAGSLGADLVAVRGDLAFLAEVKSAKNGTVYFSDARRLQEQIDSIRDKCQQTGVLPVYAYRRKGVRGDAWRIYTIPGLAFHGAASSLWDQIPKIADTAQGNPVLRWDEGLPLARFLDMICRTPAS